MGERRMCSRSLWPILSAIHENALLPECSIRAPVQPVVLLKDGDARIAAIMVAPGPFHFCNVYCPCRSKHWESGGEALHSVRVNPGANGCTLASFTAHPTSAAREKKYRLQKEPTHGIHTHTYTAKPHTQRHTPWSSGL